jgi:DNA-binding MarR family transcriptional regulator
VHSSAVRAGLDTGVYEVRRGAALPLLRQLDAGHIFQHMNYLATEARCAQRSGPDQGALVAVLSAAEGLRERLEDALVAVGLSISKFDAMEQLIQAGEPVTLGTLAGKLHCVRSNVTQLVDRLEADGLVQRGSCSEDRRAIRARLTPLGVERHAAGLEAIRSVQSDVAERLNADDRARLIELLASLEG